MRRIWCIELRKHTDAVGPKRVLARRIRIPTLRCFHSWMVWRRTKLGCSSVEVRVCPETGHVGCRPSCRQKLNQFSIALRSYVRPDCRNTGSFIIYIMICDVQSAFEPSLYNHLSAFLWTHIRFFRGPLLHPKSKSIVSDCISCL